MNLFIVVANSEPWTHINTRTCSDTVLGCSDFAAVGISVEVTIFRVEGYEGSRFQV